MNIPISCFIGSSGTVIMNDKLRRISEVVDGALLDTFFVPSIVQHSPGVTEETHEILQSG